MVDKIHKPFFTTQYCPNVSIRVQQGQKVCLHTYINLLKNFLWITTHLFVSVGKHAVYVIRLYLLVLIF
jgi:hypothetical protein